MIIVTSFTVYNIAGHSHCHSHSHSQHSHIDTLPPNGGLEPSRKNRYKPTEFDMDKLRSTIKQFVRDWSEEVSFIFLFIALYSDDLGGRREGKNVNCATSLSKMLLSSIFLIFL